MKNYVFSKTTAKYQQSFYLETNGLRYYLFSQKFYKGVSNYYSKKVLLFNAIDKTKSNRDTALLRTMSKIPIYIKYIEKEYGIVVLNKTAKNYINRKNKMKWYRANNDFYEVA